MKIKDEKVDPKIARFNNHPKQILKRIRQVVKDTDNIQWSFNINDLEFARKVQIKTILQCLRDGELDKSSITEGGDYVQGIMHAFIGGTTVRVEFFLGSGNSGLTVIDADAEEED